MIPVITTVQIVGEAGALETKGANAITFFNTGAQTAYINSIKIIPGSFLEIRHNINEGDITDYSLRFENSTGTTQLTLITKKYANRGE